MNKLGDAKQLLELQQPEFDKLTIDNFPKKKQEKYLEIIKTAAAHGHAQSRSGTLTPPQGGGSPIRSAIVAASSSGMLRPRLPSCTFHAVARSALQRTPCPTSAPAS